MRETKKSDILIQLFHRECVHSPAVELDGIDSHWLTADEYQQWLAKRSDITREEVLESEWIKSCTEGYITELSFHPDGSLDEYKLFDRLHTTGQWRLEEGLLRVVIVKGENQYGFVVVGHSQSSLYSAVEYKNEELHSYLKLMPTRPKS